MFFSPSYMYIIYTNYKFERELYKTRARGRDRGKTSILGINETPTKAFGKLCA